MNDLPRQIVLRGNLVEPLFDEGNVLGGLLCGSAEGGAGHRAAVDGRADQEMVLENFPQRRGLVGGMRVCAKCDEGGEEQPGA